VKVHTVTEDGILHFPLRYLQEIRISFVILTEKPESPKAINIHYGFKNIEGKSC